MLWKITRINELRTFGCDIYPITLPPKKLYERTQEGSSAWILYNTAKLKWWDPNIKKLRYFNIPNSNIITINLVKYGHLVLH